MNWLAWISLSATLAFWTVYVYQVGHAFGYRERWMQDQNRDFFDIDEKQAGPQPGEGAGT